MTDYSSVYFDFLLLNKPIILTPFDKKEYLATSREMYFDYEKEIEGIRANDWNEVINILKEKKYYVPSKKTIDKFNEHQDGNSTKRVTDYIYSMI
jgi:CDP-glycerol glycerophosphotransferase (TagB/SpsB family)